TADHRRQLYTSGGAIGFAFLAISVLVAMTRRRKLIAETERAEDASIFINNPAPVIRADSAGNVVKTNPAADRFFPAARDAKRDIQIFSNFNLIDVDHLGYNSSYQFEQHVGDRYFFFTVKRNPSDGSFIFYGSDIPSRKEIQKEILRLSTAVEQSATAILITDLDGTINFANRACSRTSGYPTGDLIGKNTRIFKSGIQETEIYDELWKTITNGNVWSGEMLNRRKDGGLYWEEVSISPIRDDVGTLSGYLAVKEDISGRKETEEQLTRAKEEAESASRLKSEFLANMSHEIRTPMNAILGFTDFLIDDEETPNKLKNLRIIKSSGKHLLSLINDILDFSKIEADRIEIEAQPFALLGMLKHLEALMAESIREKSLYLHTSISDLVPRVVEGDEHRIAQILLNIIGNAVKFTDTGGITVNCDYSEGLVIFEVVDTGIGVDQDKLDLIFEAFQQANTSTERTHGGTGLGLAICRQLASLMNGRVYAKSQPGKGSTFFLEIPLPEVSVDEAELLEAVDEDLDQERLDNKAQGRRIVSAWLAGVNSDEMLQRVVLSGVRDLPVKLEKLKLAVAERKPEVFANIVHDLKGYSGNLKMDEVYQIAQKLYEFSNSDSFTLNGAEPYLIKLESLIRSIPGSFMTEGADPAELLESSGPDLRIITAEDNETNQELIKILLQGIGLSSDFEKDGRAVLDRLKTGSYDLLLLDMQMPVMDGKETITAIRGEPRFDDLHVIAITAHAMEGDAERYIEMGCDDYLSKPIDRELFASKIAALSFERAAADIGSREKELSLEQRTAISQLAVELRENKAIFNPASVLSIGKRLEKIGGNKMLEQTGRKLQDAARDFDDSWVDRAMHNLDEVLKNE
ncbi:MAG: PAS domain S-box protein, partial [Spirochaetales bacterium]|nr:PAS domain S-box protein [Spirochaetales bacterium]